MKTEKYNGWTNYETWNVKLWIDNDQSSEQYWNEAAQQAYDEAEAEKNFTRKERAAIDLSERLKNEHEENMPEVDGCYGDMLRAALSEVDWYEIAYNLLEEIE